MGVHIALGAEIGRALLQGREPAINRRMLGPEPIALVVAERGVHPLQVGDEDHIGATELAEEERPGRGLQGLLHQLGHANEMLFRRSGVGPMAFAVAEPLAPGPKEAPLQLPQRKHIRIAKALAEGAKGRFQFPQDHITLGDQAAIQLEGGEHPGGHPLLEPRLLLPVTEHRHLADPVRNPLLLQPQPHLLAVGTPGVVIAVERHPHLTLRAAE